MLSALRRRIELTDPDLPILAVKTLRQHLDDNLVLWGLRSGARMFLVFGLAALFLSVGGVYGLLSYLVSTRTREIGNRQALGASAASVNWTVRKEAPC